MTERKYRSVLRRIHTEKLVAWLGTLQDMQVWGKFPVMRLIVDLGRELDERGERVEGRMSLAELKEEKMRYDNEQDVLREEEK